MYTPDKAPRIKLSNGICVANFSSPHPFKFVDGSVLPACPPERAKYLVLEALEEEHAHPSLPDVVDIYLGWALTQQVLKALWALDADAEVDIILVPLPVMLALKSTGLKLQHPKVRVIRVADRVSKEIFTDRFCA